MAVQLINGAALAAFPPDWKKGIDLSLRWRTIFAAALDGQEDRAALAAAPEAAITWQLAPAADADRNQREETLRAALDSGHAAAPCFARSSYVSGLAADGSSIAVQPSLWPWAAGDWLLVYDENNAPQPRQISAVSFNGLTLTLGAPLPAALPVGAAVYPLLFGRLEVLPPVASGATVCRLTVPAWRVPAAQEVYLRHQNAPVAPEPLALAATEIQNWVQVSDDGAARRGLALRAPFAGQDELTETESFFAALDGGRLPFWLPERERAAVIAGSAFDPSGDPFTRFLVASDPGVELPLAVGALLWFSHPTKPAMAARVASIAAGPDAHTALVVLDATLANDPDADWDVYRLRAMRLGDGTLRETWRADDHAFLRLAALEVAETPEGAPIPAPPRLAYLYRFQNRRDSAAVWRFTGNGAAVALGDETYLPATISHRAATLDGGGATEDLRFQIPNSKGNAENGNGASAGGSFPGDPLGADCIAGEGITLSGGGDDAIGAEVEPLMRFAVEPPDGPLELIVRQLDLADSDPSASAQIVFRGLVARVRFTGARWEADATPAAALPDVPALNFLIGSPCNHAFCGPGCGLAESAWSVAGVLASANGAAIQLAVDPGKPPGWFAGGRLTAGTGADAEARTILASAGTALTLNAPLRRTAPGAALALRAGCSHLPEDCHGRFANFINYGGHPMGRFEI